MKPQDFNIRPGVPIFLDYLFKNHVVMIYSSARPENVKAMVDALATKKQAKSLAAIWGRDKLDLTPAQYNEKVQVYKKLEKVWQDEQIQTTCQGKKQRWNQTNTVLVDDSHLKALSQPHNLIQVPEFTKQKLNQEQKRREREVVASVRAKLEELKWAHDVSRLIWRWQTGQLEPPRATKLSPLPQSAGTESAELPSPMADDDDDPFSSDTDESSGGAAIDAALEEDMQNLMTEPRANDESHGMDKPAVSADEWKELLT
jgi:NLI interacting factor-like phosphatase